jgi:hypothetical protein
MAAPGIEEDDETERLDEEARGADASAGRTVYEASVPVLEDGPRGWQLAAPWRWFARLLR